MDKEMDKRESMDGWMERERERWMADGWMESKCMTDCTTY